MRPVPLRPRSERRSAARRPPRAASRPRWPLVVVPLLVLGVALVIAAGRPPADASGRVAPEHTVHEFGSVRMQDGVLAAAFPLSVDGQVDAVDLTTS